MFCYLGIYKLNTPNITNCCKNVIYFPTEDMSKARLINLSESDKVSPYSFARYDCSAV